MQCKKDNKLIRLVRSWKLLKRNRATSPRGRPLPQATRQHTHLSRPHEKSGADSTRHLSADTSVASGTGRYIGEGFDDARLDTLFLAMPISWRGTLQQYVGRLHRLHDSKREVIVYDYVDGCVPVFSAMYSKRIRGYEAVGYQIQDVNDYGGDDLDSTPERIMRDGQ